MNNLDKQYQSLLQDILDNGVEKKDRTGTGTLSVFGRQIRHKMSEGFPLLTTKKMHWKSIVTELLWFLRGDTNIKYLVDNNCHIWDGDCYKNYKSINPDYLANDEMFKTEKGTYRFFTQEEFINKIKTDDEFAIKWGELGPIYGKQWRSWIHHFPKTYPEVSQYEQYIGVKTIDQIANSINLLKTDPDSRRNRVSAWNVGELDSMVLPPCHTDFQFYTRELSEGERGLLLQPYGLDPLTKEGRDRVWKENNLPTRAISLMWNQRSVDTGLGLGFNIASYGLLLEIIAKEVNMVPDELIGNLGDVHLYRDHIEPIKEQLNRESFNLPLLKIHCNVDDISHYEFSNFELIGYQSHPTIKLPLSN
jgi:thymidylate synthase